MDVIILILERDKTSEAKCFIWGLRTYTVFCSRFSRNQKKKNISLKLYWLKVFLCIGMIYNYIIKYIISTYRMWRNVFGMSSAPCHPMYYSTLDDQTRIPLGDYSSLPNPCMSVVAGVLLKSTLINRPRGSSNHYIFVMLWEDSNHLPQELHVCAITTHPPESLTHSRRRVIIPYESFAGYPR